MLSKYLMGAATAVALAGPAMADNWTMTTTWPSSLELIEIDKKFVEIANALVDDADLTIEFFEGGSLVPAGEVFGAVESGTIQTAPLRGRRLRSSPGRSVSSRSRIGHSAR